MTKDICIIPARMGSSRFPGKPMKKILGKPMIEHMYKRTKLCKVISEVFVATCDKEISDFVSSIGGKAIMTSNSHERASDRCGEALLKIEKIMGYTCNLVVMVQGDEPMINPEMINQAVKPMLVDDKILVSNLMGNIDTEEEFIDPNCIKVVVDNNQDALYFSREPIPSKPKNEIGSRMKQICVIPFRRNFLLKYNTMEPTPLEIAESVDMMRVLENGHKVRMTYTDHKTFAVDKEDDILKVEKYLKIDPLLKIV